MVRYKRKLTQIITTLVTNSHIQGFINGSIYKGASKKFCVPGLNCYSCPGAMGSCPLGSLQAVIGSMNYYFSFYVLGVIGVFGSLMGRLVCGWLCPFGLIQELIYKIKSKKFRIKGKNPLKYLKYVILLVFVILMPMLIVNEVGIGAPAFCKYICPAGSLEAGIPLTILNPNLRQAIGFLFSWKLLLLGGTIISSILIYRPFCRFVCPLGAIYGLFNPISLYKLEVSEDKCIKCNKCTQACKLDIETYKISNSPECIRCGDCIDACPTDAITSSWGLKSKKRKEKLQLED